MSGVNGILMTSSRLFYAGAVEGQMPEILSMIQVSKMTPAPGVLIVAVLSLGYLCSSDIFALINYVGFATWVLFILEFSSKNIFDRPQFFTTNRLNLILILDIHWYGGVVYSLAPMETSRVGETHQGEHDLACAVHPGHRLHHRGPHDCQAIRNWYGMCHHSHSYPSLLHIGQMEEQTSFHQEKSK